ncbi:hypothetical protein [Sphingomonas sp.]|uniref:hypothetical protein n=1 Tax=Sphingomonas sp. TaxID=28214 RepID=UPI0025F9C049|nr:hypothetical protein [Sphingomonas sp.]
MIQTFADNRVQFDGDDMTWALARSGTATVQSGQLTIPADRASVVALAGDIGRIATQSAGNHNSRTFSVSGQNGNATNYFVFEEVATLSDGQPLFETRNSKGETTFTSGLYPLKLIAVIDRGQHFATGKIIAYVQISGRTTVVDVTGCPIIATVVRRVNSPMRATNRMSGSSFWLGI